MKKILRNKNHFFECLFLVIMIFSFVVPRVGFGQEAVVSEVIVEAVAPVELPAEATSAQPEIPAAPSEVLINNEPAPELPVEPVIETEPAIAESAQQELVTTTVPIISEATSTATAASTATSSESTVPAVNQEPDPNVVVEFIEKLIDSIADISKEVMDNLNLDIKEMLDGTTEESSDGPIEECIDENTCNGPVDFGNQEIVISPELIAVPTFSVPNRVYDKAVTIDAEATHRCEIDDFVVDVSDDDRFFSKVRLQRSLDLTYEIEIGSLPNGIDIRFANNDYHHQIGSSEEWLDFNIYINPQAQKGNFSIPFFYTLKSDTDSTVVCQFNIINL